MNSDELVKGMWFQTKTWNGRRLALRVQAILCDRVGPEPYHEGDGVWVLGIANTWRLYIHGDGHSAELSHHEGKTRKFWDALRVVLEELL